MSSDDEDEEDYMSDTFLPKGSDEIRPGLITSATSQRSNAVAAKKKRYDDEYREKFKSKKVLEQERRDEGLSSAISSKNKGFEMLTKMGYKQGQAIGKSAQGILEPIGIDVKMDRGGLGREAALKQLKERRQAIRMSRLRKDVEENSTVSTAEFRKRMTQKVQGKQMEADLGKCQRACEKLDLEQKIDRPAMPWFWPNRKTDVDDAESHESDEDNDNDCFEYELVEKLEMLTDYLRTTYCFCHWCGTKYLDLEDMNNGCPGLTKDDH